MICSGTHKGNFIDINPAGKTVTWPVIVIYGLSNGIVEDVWAEVDVLSLMQQLDTELKSEEER